MRVVVEVGGWEHECCGAPYERDSTVEVTCLVIPAPDPAATRYVESHHDRTSRHQTVTVRGRVADLRIEHPDGSTEPIERLPGGRALRGFDDEDDGHLEQPGTGEPVSTDSDHYLLTIVA